MTRLTEIKSEWDHIAVLNEGWTGNATFKRAGKVVSLNARLVAGETPPLVVGSIPNEFRPYSPPGQTMNGLAVNINQADGKPRRYNYYRGQITIVGAAPGGTYEIRDTYLTTSPPPRFLVSFLVWLRGGHDALNEDRTTGRGHGPARPGAMGCGRRSHLRRNASRNRELSGLQRGNLHPPRTGKMLSIYSFSDSDRNGDSNPASARNSDIIPICEKTFSSDGREGRLISAGVKRNHHGTQHARQADSGDLLCAHHGMGFIPGYARSIAGDRSLNLVGAQCV